MSVPLTGARRLISLGEAAEALGISELTIRRRIADGTLPAFRVGKQIRLDALTLEQKMLRPMNSAARDLLADSAILANGGAEC